MLNERMGVEDGVLGRQRLRRRSLSSRAPRGEEGGGKKKSRCKWNVFTIWYVQYVCTNMM